MCHLFSITRFNARIGPTGSIGNALRGVPGSSCDIACLAMVAIWAMALTVRADETAAATSPQLTEHFEKKVRPLLLARCVKCHGSEKTEGGLRLDSAAGLAAGGDSGPVVVAG